MKCRITKEHVWGGVLEDRPGALAEKLQALSEGGLNLELIIGRREGAGRGLLLISPLRTMHQLDVVERAGLLRDNPIPTLRIEAPNVIGLGARITGALARAGINIQSYSGLALGEHSITNIAFDSDEEGDRAKAVLEEMFSSWHPEQPAG